MARGNGADSEEGGAAEVLTHRIIPAGEATVGRSL